MGGNLTWQAVRAEAIRRIREREWMPGSRIPDEAELAAELGCARATVNRALRDLAAEGYLERRRKGGTRVPETPVRKATFEIAVIRQDVEARGHRHGYRLLGDETGAAPDEIASALGLPKGTPLRHVRALHLADDAPFCLEIRWLNPELVPPERAVFDALSANEWLLRNLAYSAGSFGFSARTADAELAALMACPEGAALLAMDRTTFMDAVPITAATLIYREGYRLATTM
ncbi:GntR family transcriptional regulator [Salinarimonas ramus]|uniref:GntR family transcriptional regulator n=1 Tax=Salinarimonas ramus TaxID=690164 RepID=UPI001AEEB8F4|nr:GntR family transcriptional regulator [Salinarimonas ramus]